MGRTQSRNKTKATLGCWAMFMSSLLQQFSLGELGQMSSRPSADSVECNSPETAQRKIVNEFTWATSAASSTLSISTGREQEEHHSDLRVRLRTMRRSI